MTKRSLISASVILASAISINQIEEAKMNVQEIDIIKPITIKGRIQTLEMNPMEIKVQRIQTVQMDEVVFTARKRFVNQFDDNGLANKDVNNEMFDLIHPVN